MKKLWIAVAFLLVGCEAAPEKGLRISLQETKPKELRSLFSGPQIMSSPTSINDFDCVTANITSEKISENDPGCPSHNNMRGPGFGITTEVIWRQSEIYALVPEGQNVQIDVYGVYPAHCSATNLHAPFTSGYYLGGVNVDLFEFLDIKIPVTYTGDIADVTCPATSNSLDAYIDENYAEQFSDPNAPATTCAADPDNAGHENTSVYGDLNSVNNVYQTTRCNDGVGSATMAYKWNFLHGSAPDTTGFSNFEIIVVARGGHAAATCGAQVPTNGSGVVQLYNGGTYDNVGTIGNAVSTLTLGPYSKTGTYGGGGVVRLKIDASTATTGECNVVQVDHVLLRLIP